VPIYFPDIIRILCKPNQSKQTITSNPKSTKNIKDKIEKH